MIVIPDVFKWFFTLFYTHFSSTACLSVWLKTKRLTASLNTKKFQDEERRKLGRMNDGNKYAFWVEPLKNKLGFESNFSTTFCSVSREWWTDRNVRASKWFIDWQVSFMHLMGATKNVSLSTVFNFCVHSLLFWIEFRSLLLFVHLVMDKRGKIPRRKLNFSSSSLFLLFFRKESVWKTRNGLIRWKHEEVDSLSINSPLLFQFLLFILLSLLREMFWSKLRIKRVDGSKRHEVQVFSEIIL